MKTHHILPDDLRKIITEHFFNKGEVVSKCDLDVKQVGGECGAPTYYVFKEAIAYTEEKNGIESKECSTGSKTCCGACESNPS